MFDWNLMRSFLAVADTGSYSAAARRTGISQPTIGRHIEQLQDQLGVILLRRSRTGYDLTETGQDVLARARAMQAAAAGVSRVAEGRTDAIRGTVRVTASVVVATYVLLPMIEAAMTAEPELQIELVATDSTENLTLREADIAVRMARPGQPDLIARKLGEISLGIFAARAYLDRFGRPDTLADLRRHRLLGYDRSDLILRGMAAAGLDLAREDFRFRSDDQVAGFEALKAGLGIGPCQRQLARAAGLVDLFPDLEIPPLPVWLAAHKELRSSARVRFVYDFLAESLTGYLRAS